MRACTADHCTFKGLRCCVQMPSLRLSLHSIQPPVSDRETGKQSQVLHRLGTALFLVPSSHIYERLEISRSSVRHPFARGQLAQELCPRSVLQVGNLIPIVLNSESFSTRGIRGMGVLSRFIEPL